MVHQSLGPQLLPVKEKVATPAAYLNARRLAAPRIDGGGTLSVPRRARRSSNPAEPSTETATPTDANSQHDGSKGTGESRSAAECAPTPGKPPTPAPRSWKATPPLPVPVAVATVVVCTDHPHQHHDGDSSTKRRHGGQVPACRADMILDDLIVQMVGVVALRVPAKMVPHTGAMVPRTGAAKLIRWEGRSRSRLQLTLADKVAALRVRSGACTRRGRRQHKWIQRDREVDVLQRGRLFRCLGEASA